MAVVDSALLICLMSLGTTEDLLGVGGFPPSKDPGIERKLAKRIEGKSIGRSQILVVCYRCSASARKQEGG